MARSLAIVRAVLAGVVFVALQTFAATAAPAEIRTSGFAAGLTTFIEIESRLSEDAVRENAALAYDIASDDAVAARGGAGLVDDAARVAGGGTPNRIYSAKELVRRAAEPGPYHNFPESFNARIFSGNRQVISENYVLYSQRGTINGVNGTFEIGVRPSVSGNTETIMHRFFRPD